MRKLIFFLILLIVSVLATPAFADEEVVYRYIDVAHYDIWKHSSGTWTSAGRPGEYRTFDWQITLPQSILEKYDITSVRVEYPVTEQKYQEAGGRYGIPWQDFELYYLNKSPWDVSVTGQLVSGKINVKAKILLGPIERAIDLTDPANRSVYDPLGKDPGFARATEGWRWEVPVLFKALGTPKVKTPSATLDGAFLDLPKKVSSEFQTTIIRTTNPEWGTDWQGRIKVVWALYDAGDFVPLDIHRAFDQQSIRALKQRVLYDEYVILDQNQKAWVKTFTFPAPSPRETSVIFVQHEGCTNVYQQVFQFEGEFLRYSYTTGRDKITDHLPWAWMEKQYGVKRPGS